MAFRPPCLRALYKKTKHFIQERTQRKQTSKQINKQKKREVKMKTAKNTPTQHCPEKPTVSQTSPPSRLLSCSPSSLHTLFLAPPSHHPSLSPLTNTRTTACTHASTQSAAQITRTPTSAVGISPMEQLAEVQVVPGKLLSLCLAQHSPLPAQRPHPILPELPHLTHTGTEKELAEYPHYAASLRQEKKELRTTKNKQGG